MAILKTEDNEVEVADGDALMAAAEELGVPFGCRQGVCGTCKVRVEEGIENCANKTENEDAMGLEDGERLMCQCAIKSGDVKISFD